MNIQNLEEVLAQAYEEASACVAAEHLESTGIMSLIREIMSEVESTDEWQKAIENELCGLAIHQQAKRFMKHEHVFRQNIKKEIMSGLENSQKTTMLEHTTDEELVKNVKSISVEFIYQTVIKKERTLLLE
jgi:predicted SprT family Zn-dependent metalloprotease